MVGNLWNPLETQKQGYSPAHSLLLEHKMKKPKETQIEMVSYIVIFSQGLETLLWLHISDVAR